MQDTPGSCMGSKVRSSVDEYVAVVTCVRSRPRRGPAATPECPRRCASLATLEPSRPTTSPQAQPGGCGPPFRCVLTEGSCYPVGAAVTQWRDLPGRHAGLNCVLLGVRLVSRHRQIAGRVVQETAVQGLLRLDQPVWRCGGRFQLWRASRCRHGGHLLRRAGRSGAVCAGTVGGVRWIPTGRSSWDRR
jgi:hypothetical protein